MDAAPAAAPSQPVIKSNGLPEKETNGAFKQKRLNPIKLRQMRERVREIEEEITKLEAGIAECEQSLQTFVSAEETARTTHLLESRRGDLNVLMREWEEVSVVIEGA